MKRKAKARVAVGVVMLIIVLIAVPTMLQTTSAQGMQAGVYQIDPIWPKPLPNRWVFGSVVGLAVDSRDHVWVVHRGKASIDPDLGGMMTYPPDGPRGGGEVRPLRRVRSPNTAASRRRRSWSLTRRKRGRTLGRSGRGLRVAAFHARHHAGWERQRLACR